MKKQKSMVNRMVNRIFILNAIFSHFQQITQWLPNHIETAAKYMYKAESLIEVLESDDCESIGGFDRTSPVLRESGFMLYDRFLALVRKYNNKSDIEKECQFDLDTLGAYFKQLFELRSSF